MQAILKREAIEATIHAYEWCCKEIGAGGAGGEPEGTAQDDAAGAAPRGPSKERKLRNVLRCLESAVRWQPDTAQYLCDLWQAAPMLLAWLDKNRYRLGESNVSFASSHLVDADTFSAVHHTVFCQAAHVRLGYNKAGGWLKHSKVALAMNEQALARMWEAYFWPELGGVQCAFGLVDWLRACLVVVLMCPLLESWIKQHGDVVFIWAVKMAWDIACVLGQMPVNRTGAKGTKGSEAGQIPEAERRRIQFRIDDSVDKKLGYDDDARCRDKRAKERMQWCQWLSSVVTQRIMVLMRVLHDTQEQSQQASMAAVSTVSAGERLRSFFGQGSVVDDGTVPVPWASTCTQDCIDAIPLPALHAWVATASISSPPAAEKGGGPAMQAVPSLGPHLLQQSPLAQTSPLGQPRGSPTPSPMLLAECTPPSRSSTHAPTLAVFTQAPEEWASMPSGRGSGPEISEVMPSPLMLPWRSQLPTGAALVQEVKNLQRRGAHWPPPPPPPQTHTHTATLPIFAQYAYDIACKPVVHCSRDRILVHAVSNAARSLGNMQPGTAASGASGANTSLSWGVVAPASVECREGVSSGTLARAMYTYVYFHGIYVCIEH
jgi:hypothetical protein